MVKLCYFALKFVGNEIKCIWFSEMHQAVTSIELLNDIFIARRYRTLSRLQRKSNHNIPKFKKLLLSQILAKSYNFHIEKEEAIQIKYLDTTVLASHKTKPCSEWRNRMTRKINILKRILFYFTYFW